jgi:predicted AlkP superfamily pyrophosphatase or phosphodiesterase
MKITRTQNLLTAAVGLLAFMTTIAWAADPALPKGNAVEPAPRLILQITVDQLRGDLPGRFVRNMGEGGFRYLMNQGVWYGDAHHAHANTETIVGHTTLATGADPAVHGMVGNVWLDRQTGKLTYNIEDPKYRILTPGADVNKATEIDPTQKVASTDGRSPAAILGSTFSDELAIYTGGRAKIFGVSIKDRGAVSMAGHAGKAFWFSKASGEFVTSSYYYDRYPGWVNQWNQQKLPNSYSGKSWELLHAKSSYLFGDADDEPWETDFAGYGRLFPHLYGSDKDKYFTTRLTLSPAGDDLTLAFAKTLIDAEQLGQHEVTDYLSISFSSTDYVGHIFGPSSLEMEDNLLRLDRTLAELFAFVDKRIGLQNVLIVLSADHGGPEAPGYLNSLGIPAKYMTPEKWDKEPAISALKQKFGIGKELIQSYRPYVYLNREAIREKGLDEAVVEKAVVEELMKFDGLTVTVTHGSPWNYDNFVPVVFAGGKLAARRVYRPIETVDVAPTLSAIVGAKPPSGSRGAPLPEVLQGAGR